MTQHRGRKPISMTLARWVRMGKPLKRTVSTARRTHILGGDATGGGHRHGTGRPKKTEFPAHWSDNKIIKEIESVANDPAATSVVQADLRERRAGTRDGIDITVVIGADGTEILTGFPTNVTPNP